jgi:DNA gyrase/topoisomerase IV subunit A
VRQAYEEGKGGILMRGKMHIEDGSTTTGSGGGASGKRRAKRNAGGGTASKPLVVITELPYQTNKVGAGQD